MTPKIFGWEHLTYLAVCLIIAITSLVLIKIYAKKEKVQNIIVRCVGFLLFACVIWNRVELVLHTNNWAYIVPDSFCGMSSFVLGLTTMFGKRNNAVLHFVFYVAVVGDVVTLAYPDFIETTSSLFVRMTFSGLTHHAISWYLCTLLLVVNWFRPNYKRSGNLVVGFLAYITVGAFLISVLKRNDAFYIFNPILSGTPLTVWVLAPIFTIIYISFMIVYELIKRKLKKKEKPDVDLVKIIKSNNF